MLTIRRQAALQMDPCGGGVTLFQVAHTAVDPSPARYWFAAKPRGRSMTQSYDFKVVNDGKWKIDCNGQEFGPFASKDVAMEAANAAASKVVALGRKASVLVGPAS